ncbi:MAG: UPF0280 family protein [Alphaproteobacteria bacterium]|nr:UPF0280 family protein [Alphaproteobacteria bacterium]
MARGPQIAMLPDGKRLHLQYGPTDLIVEADGEHDEVAAAYRQAIARFRTLLPELVGELPRLRQPMAEDMTADSFRYSTARRMAEAARLHRGVFVTPMAGVAGAVADEVLAAMVKGRRLHRAYANNGGDIAIHLEDGAEFTVGLVDRPEAPEPAGRFTITHAMPVRGVATSGRQGRSFSLGIADAVTVLARSAAAADVAATLIANRVNIDHPAIERRPAQALDPDSDLGPLPVTVSVGPLDEASRDAALDAGLACAEAMREAGLIHSAVLALYETYRVVGPELAKALPVAA